MFLQTASSHMLIPYGTVVWDNRALCNEDVQVNVYSNTMPGK